MNQMTARDFVNIENGLGMGLINGASPAISPNNPQQQTPNNLLQTGIQQQQQQQPPPPMSEDNRKIPPIGNERTRKFFSDSSLVPENIGQGGQQWVMDKAPQMPHWMQSGHLPPLPRVNHFDDMHVPSEQFHVSFIHLMIIS